MIGHNPYGDSSVNPTWRARFAPAHVAEADLDRLVQALDDGFRNTAPPTPGRCTDAARRCASIWYLETGYQTDPDAAHQACGVRKFDSPRNHSPRGPCGRYVAR